MEPIPCDYMDDKIKNISGSHVMAARVFRGKSQGDIQQSSSLKRMAPAARVGIITNIPSAARRAHMKSQGGDRQSFGGDR